jgi:hypothetical protein
MGALSALPAPTSGINAWQKIRKALTDRNPAIQRQFEELRLWLATQKGNPDLYFAPFSAAEVATADDGHGVGAGTAKLYGVFFKKKNTATDAFASIVDNGTDDNYYSGSLTGSVRVQVALLDGNDAFAATFPTGLAIALGLRVVSTTAAAAGTTASGAGDGPDGFLIYGAA